VAQHPERFINREAELAELRRLAVRPGPALVLVYGRRQVDKTYLLDHAWADRRFFYYLAAQGTATINRNELLRELGRWSGRTFAPDDYPTWRTLLRLLAELAQDEALIVVLDEVQYLLGDADDFASQLVAVWDRDVRGRALTLVLSGSEIATLERLAGGGQPLYGRFALARKLAPFDYYDARRFMPERPLRDAAYFYGALGGMPRYLAEVDAGEPLDESLTRLMLAPGGPVHLQIERIIEQEQGIRQPAEYHAVLAAVAEGATQVSAIATRVGTDERSTRRVLEILERLDLVRRERNFAAAAKTPWCFLIADHAVRFWYRFVRPHRSLLERGQAEAVWHSQVAPLLNDFMGKAFEGMVQAAYLRHYRRWGLALVLEWARWEGHDRARRPIEIDLVARLDDGRILTGEVKWASQPIGREVHLALQRDLEDLARSGQGWARDALSTERSAGYLYVAASGFTQGFQQLAATDPRIRLLTLAELYGE
jgi:uncharacterized protein